MNRRKFIYQSGLAAGALLLQKLDGFAATPADVQRLTILHTNDVHTRLEPFPMDGSRNQGLGGVAARANVIRGIRAEGGHLLLLDAGDIFQGTPYFNLYKGEPEMKAMSAMGYDACTMGNHDFDAGLDNFVTQLQHASFPVVICNYDFTGTPAENRTIPYKVIRRGKLKIGIFGVGIEMKGLVPDNLYGNTVYNDPVQKANETAGLLKDKEKCDMVICLSHLGYEYKDNKVSDKILAKETEQVDLIIGGHTHTFMPAPEVLKNKKGSDVIINQVGWAGIQLGRLDFEFSGVKKKSLTNSNSIVIGKKTSE